MVTTGTVTLVPFQDTKDHDSVCLPQQLSGRLYRKNFIVFFLFFTLMVVAIQDLMMTNCCCLSLLLSSQRVLHQVFRQP